jgi:DNA end-binding protein Ku
VRPYWKGYLKLALVSCPIALHAACSTAERIAFRQVNKVTGNRLRQQLIDEETREPVAPQDKGRAYAIAKGQYLIVEDAELESDRDRKHPHHRDRQLCAALADRPALLRHPLLRDAQ